MIASLTHLAVDLKLAAANQSQALAAILFLYRDVVDNRCQPSETCRERERHPGFRWFSALLKFGACSQNSTATRGFWPCCSTGAACGSWSA